ncbi:MAG TPA: polysaccharide biosynthesis/export family protein [Verrucomicrobiota bacterium]|nr:polysaccharide biosynthesis/export family protein [Verrucomicrobiota bacterium]HNT14627.1 polysaccharide biosynthesis/export family protein [Verrucomicrobiota bacterium]
MKKVLALHLLLAGLILLVGCQIPRQSSAPRFDPRATGTFSNAVAGLVPAQPLDAALLAAPQEHFRLGPGDELQIEVIDQLATRSDVTVGPDGKIYFYLLPGIDVWGMTLAETKRALEKDLEKYIAGPQVAISLRAVGSKQIWVLGAVAHPGVYPAPAPMTLLEAMALAGGTRNAVAGTTTVDMADLRHAFVVRNGNALPVDFQRLLEQGDMSQNIYLQSGDFVYVPSGAAREIYLFGAVRMPRAIALSETPTLVAAITAGGGPLRDAYLSQVAIVRGSLTHPEMAVVNYRDILEGRAGDIPLEPRDIIFVPNSPYRFLRNYVDAVINTFVFSAAANEGAAAFGGTPAGVGVSVGNR